jgi:AraC-like DNA-binding protein
MYIDPFVILNLTGIMVGSGAFIYVLTHRHAHVPPSKYLGLLILYMALLYTLFMVRSIYHVAYFGDVLLFGPGIFYLYIRARLRETTIRDLLLHASPGAATVLISMIGSLLTFGNPVLPVINEAALLLIAGYSVAGFVQLRLAEAPLDMRRSVRVLLWINLLTVVMLAIMVIKYPRYAIEYILSYYMCLIIQSAVVALIRESWFIIRTHPDRKYSRSSLTSEMKAELVEKIRRLMENEKYFTNNLASLSDVATRLGSTPNHVSQVINECLQTTFLDLLSEYRIEAARQLLAEDHTSVEGIAESVGFNSKSSFYTAFKKHTGLTPSEFRSRLNSTTR